MSTVKVEDLLNVEDAAAVVGCTPGRIRQLLRAKELVGVKVNDRAWLIPRELAEKLAKNRPRKGRPPTE